MMKKSGFNLFVCLFCFDKITKGEEKEWEIHYKDMG